MRRLAAWIRRVARRDRLERELNRELAYHVERRVEEEVERGRSRREAERQVRLEFGGVDQIKEECRDARGTRWIEDVFQDCRYASRTLRRSPVFAAVAILSLALGIGANAAVFQLLDAIAWRPLPVPDPRALAEIQIDGGTQGFGVNMRDGTLTYPLFEQIRDHQEAFSGVFAWAPGTLAVGRGTELRRLRVAWVSGEAFAVLGVRPERGRLLDAEDDRPGCAGRVVLGHAFWQRQFQGDEAAIGSELVLSGRPQEVIGVTPPEFFGIRVGQNFDVALPFCAVTAWDPNRLQRRDLFWIRVLGRRNRDWTTVQAASYLRTAGAGWFRAVEPANYTTTLRQLWSSFRLSAEPRATGVSQLRSTYQTSLWVLLGITALVLAVACANLANLTLARTLSRGREIATRLALGASRGRVVSQLFAESLLLTAIGGLAGVALAGGLARVLVALLRRQNQAFDLDLRVDWRVLTFMVAAGLAASLFFGLSTAVHATRARALSAPGAGSRGTTTDRRRFAVQRLLIAGQVAVSLVLVVSALLFLASFRHLVTMDAGFRQEGIVYSYLDLPPDLSPEAAQALKPELLRAIRSIAGVESATTSTHLPLSGERTSLGVRDARTGQDTFPQFTWVSPGYFETMEIPILSGRDFNEFDTRSSLPVLIVNQRFARDHFGDASPIGQAVRSLQEPGYPETVYEVVGLVADTKYADLRQGYPPIAYAPDAQDPGGGATMAVVTRSPLPVSSLMPALREAVARVNGAVVASDTVDLRAQVVDGLSRESLLAWVAGFFGVLAMALVGVGVYGVVSYMVSSRRHEIGIRMALGADAGSVVGMVLRQTAGLTLMGCGVGVAAGLLATRLAARLLFGVTASDPASFAVAIAVLLAVALASAYVPGRRAARLDPVHTLRAD